MLEVTRLHNFFRISGFTFFCSRISRFRPSETGWGFATKVRRLPGRQCNEYCSRVCCSALLLSECITSRMKGELLPCSLLAELSITIIRAKGELLPRSLFPICGAYRDRNEGNGGLLPCSLSLAGFIVTRTKRELFLSGLLILRVYHHQN